MEFPLPSHLDTIHRYDWTDDGHLPTASTALTRSVARCNYLAPPHQSYAYADRSFSPFSTTIALLSLLLHCALASGAMYCNRSCLCLCVCGGRAVSEPYYSQRARSVCVSGRFFIVVVDLGTHARALSVNEYAHCQRNDLLRRRSKDV